jgi:hypothetical protein
MNGEHKYENNFQCLDTKSEAAHLVRIKFLVVFFWNFQGRKPLLGSLAAVEAELERHWKLA